MKFLTKFWRWLTYRQPKTNKTTYRTQVFIEGAGTIEYLDCETFTTFAAAKSHLHGLRNLNVANGIDATYKLIQLDGCIYRYVWVEYSDGSCLSFNPNEEPEPCLKPVYS